LVGSDASAVTDGGLVVWDGTTGKKVKAVATTSLEAVANNFIVGNATPAWSVMTPAAARAALGFQTTGGSTDDALVKFDGTAGATQNSTATLTDAGLLTTANLSLTADSNQLVLDSNGTYTTTLTSATIGANATITLPSATATLWSTKAGEINALTAKNSVVLADVLVIEDSADTYAKKKVTQETLFANVSQASFAASGLSLTSSTKVAIFDVSTIGSGLTRTYITPNADGTLQLGATAAELNTGTSLIKAATADALAGSNIGTKVIQMQVVADTTDLSTDTLGYFFIPACMNGWELVRAQAMVATAGTTNATTVQVRNLTKYASNDALSGAISIASAGTIGTAGTVDASYKLVDTNDKMRVKVESVSTTAPKGLYVICEFRQP
jgi:hypothetical protein